MKKLKELLNGVNVGKVYGDTDREIGHIHFDSRKIEPGDVFIAQRGVNADGHAFIDKALTRGAVAVVCEQLPENRPEEVTYIWTADTSEALGVMAGNYWDNPSRELKLVGVTGTNGKTTTATLLYELVRLAGEKAGLLSTVCNYIGEEKIPATHTTPDALSIQELLRRMVDAGCRYCFMEASSHAIHQKRIAGLDFDGAIFSNITHDHLDYHKTFKAYIEAKKAFFDRLPAHAFALTNADDKNGLVMLQNTRAHRYTYSCRTMADFTAKVLEKHLDGTLLRLDGEEVWTKFTGDFNAYNLLAVYAAARLLGFPKENVLEYVSLLVPVSGRFETILSNEGVMAIVDYAHTPDALENILKTARGFAEGRIVTLFGCGGDRDPFKRPIMGRIGAELADLCVVTSDNPRTEDPMAIIDAIVSGMQESAHPYVVIENRVEAIGWAMAHAQKDDVIVLCGKGHETYQEIGHEKRHLDEREVVADFLGREV